MRADVARFEVRVKPRASRDGVEGCRDGVYQVRLCAPPVEGAANDALVKVLSRQLGVSRSRISIISGQRSRNKVVQVSGLTADQVRELME